MLKRRRRQLEEQTLHVDSDDQGPRKRQNTVLDVTARPNLSDASSVATNTVTPSIENSRIDTPRGRRRNDADNAASSSQLQQFQVKRNGSQSRRGVRTRQELVWEPLSERQRLMIRKLLQNTYNHTVTQHGSALGDAAQDNEMKRALQNLMKALDKRMQRTLLPKVSREFLFDPEVLENKVSELEKQMEEELEEIEELERSLAKAEQTNERQKMELKRLQERTRRDQRNVVEMEKSLYEKWPLLQMPPDSNDYVRSLLLYPSSRFT